MNIIINNLLSMQRKEVDNELSIEQVAGLIDNNLPFVVFLNGKILLKKQYKISTTPDDNITAIVLPAGGVTNNQSERKAYQTLGGILIIGAAFATGGASLALFGSGGVLLAAGGVFNPPKPTSPDRLALGSAPSPSYSLNFQSNTARLGQAIPVAYGRNKIFPDLAMFPYHEYVDDDQILYMLLCIGQGEYNIENIFIGDSPIANYNTITFQQVEPKETLTLFHSNVEIVSEVDSQLLNPPDGSNLVITGPFTGNKAGTKGNKIGYDIICPNGLYNTDSEGKFTTFSVTFSLQYRQIDDDNNPVTDWVANRETLSRNNADAIRQTFNYDVPEGRYEIQAHRITNELGKSHIKDDVYLAGAKVYLTDIANYDNSTLLAIKVPSSAQLSTANSRRISCVVNKKNKVWTPAGGWSATAITNNSMVWSLADMLTSEWGANLPYSRIDINNFYNIGQELESRNDRFNYIYDRKVSLWESVDIIAKSCRASCVVHNGKFKIIRDKLQTVPRALFSPRNIVRGTFSVDLTLNKDKNDGIIAEFVDEQTWYPDNISVTADGEGNPTNPIEIKFSGITNRQQAVREAIFYSRNAKYRRTSLSFTTEFDAYICNYGDLIAISHPMMSWGVSGDVIGFDAANELVELSNDVEFSAGQHNIAFRSVVGDIGLESEVFSVAESKSFVRLGGTQTYTVTDDNVTIDRNGTKYELYFGGNQERTKFVFGTVTNYYKKAVIKEIKFLENKATINAIVEDERVHA